MGRTVEEIGAEIAQVKDELACVKGTECGVYARITGYYRPLRNWNAGKKEEYRQRKVYAPSETQVKDMLCYCCGNETAPMAHIEKE